jgi:hypothetical protein
MIGCIYLISKNLPRLVVNLSGIRPSACPGETLGLPKGIKFGVDDLGGFALSRETPIVKCQTCADIADQAFDPSGQDRMGEIATTFLNHVMQNHTGELLGVLAERYGPVFLAKREMR